MESIDEIIRLREEAIQKLCAEKKQLEDELEALNKQLTELNDQLRRLGYISASKDLRRPRGKMDNGLYQGVYREKIYTLRVEDGIGLVDGINGQFTSLSPAASAVKKSVTGRKMSAAGPKFWKKVD